MIYAETGVTEPSAAVRLLMMLALLDKVVGERM